MSILGGVGVDETELEVHAELVSDDPLFDNLPRAIGATSQRQASENP